MKRSTIVAVGDENFATFANRWWRSVGSVKRSIVSVAIVLLIVLTHADALGADLGPAWPQFRGPQGNGIVEGQSIPAAFGEQQALTWKTKLPGRGWSSPVIADGKVWMTTAIEHTPDAEERITLLRQTENEEKKFKSLAIAKSIELRLLAVDFEAGTLLHSLSLSTIDQPDAIHSLNSYASPTPVVDGGRLYCHFGTYGTFCIDRATRETVWSRVLPLKHAVGPGSSPLVHGDKLVLIQDGLHRQYVTALNKATGATLWETDRPEMDAPSGDMKKAYCTPVAITDPQGRQQLFCMGSQWMVSYEPETGSELWRLYHGKGFSVVPRPVYHNGIVYFATGFAKPQLFAVRTDGSGDVTDSHVVWTTGKGMPQKPSPLLHDGLIYVIDDNGVATCLSASTGAEVWKHRLGGTFSSSPVLVDGKILVGNHDGEVFVMRPGVEFELISKNQLSGQIMASPAIVENALILRTDQAVYRFD